MIKVAVLNSDSKKKKPREEAAEKRYILLLGKGRRAHAVCETLSNLRPPVREAAWDEDLLENTIASCLAVVLVEPLSRTPIMHAARVTRVAIGDAIVPLFVVVANGRSDRQVRNVYDLGVSAVIKWPKEKAMLTQLLAELIGIAQVRGKASEPDVALARAVKAHLRLSEGLSNGFRIRTSRGDVHVSGELDSLGKKERLRESISRVPGVKGVVLEELRISASGRSDHAIARSVKTTLRNTDSIDPTTLSIRVQNGYVTLAGTIPDGREMNRVLEKIQNVQGVRGIDNLTTLCP